MDTIVYVTYSTGGGVDGLDHTDKGGNMTGAYLDKRDTEKHMIKAYNVVKAEVHDLDEVRKSVLRKLSPLERLALEKAGLNIKTGTYL